VKPPPAGIFAFQDLRSQILNSAGMRRAASSAAPSRSSRPGWLPSVPSRESLSLSATGLGALRLKAAIGRHAFDHHNERL